jgi:hypothetical protein
MLEIKIILNYFITITNSLKDIYFVVKIINL